MIQDIEPYKFDNSYKAGAVPADTDLLIIYSGLKLVFKTENGELMLPDIAEAARLWGINKEELVYLFSIDDTAFYYYGGTVGEAGGYSFGETRMLRNPEPRHLTFAAAVGSHLAHWYESNRFCGCCGTRNNRKKDERALVCPECGHVQYPRISPVVITAITDGDRILVAHYNPKHMKTGNFYVLIAGYVEIGESLEETVRREIKEEVGLDVKNIRYRCSQPWPFSDTLIAGFYAEVDGDTALKLQENELSAAVWLSRDEIPPRANLRSVTDMLIDDFRLGLENEPFRSR